mmetsp:Transcript_57549/g.134816  ORF Transcript_57549/g.134816 Transcript_57549/m.134816 type:complete len:605 (-) Transcript_57549:97-1911(-)
MDLDTVLNSIRHVWEKLQAFGATCGATTKHSRREEIGLTHVFVLHPLDSEQPEAARATQRGARLLHEGRADESIRELHDAREMAPRSHVACSNLGCAYQAKNDDRAALYWYREAHRLDSHDETATFALALLEQRRGQAEEAQRLLMAFLQDVDSAHVGALRQLGRLHQRECHWSQAAGCFHRLIAVDPTNDEWPAQLQVCLDQLELKDGSGQAFHGRAFSFDEAVPSRCSRSARRATGNDPLSATSTTCSSWTGQMQASSRNSGAPGFSPIQESFQSSGGQHEHQGYKDSVGRNKKMLQVEPSYLFDRKAGEPVNRGALPLPRERERDGPLTIGWNELIQPEHLVLGPQLGAGGSAQVFRGCWQGQEVAVKRISGLAHLEAMKKEVDALRRLRHPRLVRFIGACVQPPLLLVVTEYMAGGSLHDHLFGPRKTVPLSSLQRWTISVQTAEGLSYLHSQRVVHRDLKSMNILLDSAQNAKICDFGLAHQMCMESTHIARKLDGEGGSPRYMAPECYDAKMGKLTEKVDIWAAGCILIELFAGILPYADCQNMPQLTARILVEKRPPDVPVGTPPQVVALIGRCVMFDPVWRLTASELQSELSSLRR